MRILIIDNTIDADSWGSEPLRRYARMAPGATVVVRRAPDGDLPRGPEGFDRVILSGSRTSAMDTTPWVESLHEFIRRTVDSGKPFLGVCFGHQSLARALSRRMVCRLAAAPEYGWIRVEKVAESPILKGLPAEFHTFSSHQDEVFELPPGFKNLARSSECEIQACELPGKAVFGIQFHPEKNLDEGKLVYKNRMSRKLPLVGDFRQSEKLFDPKVADILFGNFFRV